MRDVQELLESVSPRTLHQFKTYNAQYVKWCKYIGLVKQEEEQLRDEKELYMNLPLSAYFIHWFLLETFITQNFKFSVLEDYVKSFTFLESLCQLYGNKTCHVDVQYLKELALLHSLDTRASYDALFRVSANLWNPHSPTLNKSYFKSSLEKFRFLADFQLANYLKFSFSDRSQIKFGNLRADTDNNTITVEMPGVKPMALLPQDCPFACPLTSLASYLFIRFYGITDVSKGDTFPSLEEFHKVPIVKGKFNYEYPRETTMGVHYSTVFKYCNLSYRKKLYFESKFHWAVDVDFSEFLAMGNEYKNKKLDHSPQDTVFGGGIPFDVQRILNFKDPYVSYEDATNFTSSYKKNQMNPPMSLLLQVFPEIEDCRGSAGISPEAEQFLKVMEVMRFYLVSNLPVIYKIFPEHDIFKHEMFANADFQSYLNDSTFEIDTNLPFSLPSAHDGSGPFTLSDFYRILIDPSQDDKQGVRSPQSKIPAMQKQSSGITDDTLDEFRKQNFQFVQFQTLSNFKTLLTFLSKVFDNLSIKRSSKDKIIKQLSSLNDTLSEKINNSTPKDIKDYFLKNEIIRHSQKMMGFDDTDISSNTRQTKKNSFKLLAIDESSSNEDDTDDNDSSDNEQPVDENMQEELKYLVNELVTSKIDSIVMQQLETFEDRLEKRIDRMISDKIESNLDRLTVKRNISSFPIEHDSDENEDDDFDDDFNPTKKPRFDHVVNQYNSNSRKFDLERKNLTSSHSDQSPINEPKFMIDKNIDSIEGIVLEWFTPNSELGNECIHSMNKKYGKQWRTDFESMYKERKVIVEFYVYLINEEKIDRYEAIEICNKIRGDMDLTQFSKFLKNWKKSHNGSFSQLLKSM